MIDYGFGDYVKNQEDLICEKEKLKLNEIVFLLLSLFFIFSNELFQFL